MWAGGLEVMGFLMCNEVIDIVWGDGFCYEFDSLCLWLS